MSNLADGYTAVLRAAAAAARPDPALKLDEWSEQHMVLSRGNARPGPYRLAYTPMARRILQCLSPGDPCKRVVVRGASQMLKTQIAINAIGGWIHMAPANILALEPTDKLAKRLSARIGKAIADVPVLRQRVAAPRSRDNRNTIDAKDFIDGSGALYIVTAGAATNLAEIPARYIIFDEVDRMAANIEGEGDPISLGEARATTFARSCKFYAVSSPKLRGSSKIDALHDQGTQEVYLVPCPHCGHHHELTLANFRYARDPDTGFMARAWFVCPECGAEIDERHKTQMLRDADCGGTAHWHARSRGDGDTVSFSISAFYAPAGSIGWLALAREHAHADRRQKQGDEEAMKTFWNTRLALSWKVTHDATTAEQLKALADAHPFPLRRVPRQALVLTAGVDVQDNRLECVVWGHGRDGRMWTIDYRVFWGDPGAGAVWRELDVYLTTRFPHEGGQRIGLDGVGIDTQGHFTHQVYLFCMAREHRRIHAVRGDPKPGKSIIAGRPTAQDVNAAGGVVRDGVRLWHVGTDTAKDLFFGRLKVGLVHLSNELPMEFFEHLAAEARVGYKTARGTEYRYVLVRAGARNEALDCTVYALFAAERMKLDAYTDAEWQRLENILCPPIADLFTAPALDPLPPPPAADQDGRHRDDAPPQTSAPDSAALPLEAAAALLASHRPAAPGRRVRGSL